MRFDDVRRAVEGVPFMSSWQGRQVYDHLRQSGARDVLELGTAHGVSSAYMAAAVAANGGGRVTTVDRFHFDGPPPEETAARAGVADLVEFVRVEHSSYDWWLRERIAARTGADGVCEPLYDFCYLDGAHDWHVDGLAVVLIERLLRPGGWLLMDDLGWSYATSGVETPPNLSEEERVTPHLREVFDVVVGGHPSYTELRVQDDGWGWARKAPGEPKRLRIETTVHRSGILTRRLRMAGRRLRHRT